MHFGTHMYSVLSPNGVLTVVSPIDLTIVCIWAVVATLTFVALYFLRTRPLSISLVGAILLFILSLISSHASLTLDPNSGSVNVRTVTFFYPRTYQYPLVSVMGADVANSENADAVRLVFVGGSDLQLTPYNQMGGKGQVAFAINQFLRQHGGAGSPY